MPFAKQLRVPLLVCGLLTPCAAYAQERDTTQTPAAVLLMRYEADKKSVALAGFLEYLFPFAGYAYAGKASKGIWPSAMFLGGIAMMVPCLNENGCSEDAEETAILGFWLMVGGKVWGIVGASNTASSYNRGLRERLQIEPARTRDGYALKLGMRVPF